MRELRNANKEKSAEVEVLKEMVKSANLEGRSREIDIQKLKNKLGRQEREHSAGSRLRQHSAVSRGSSSKSPPK